jgi:hypothetical protein
MCAAGWADCNHADAACVAGACERQPAARFADCNRQAADGCETEILKDEHDCGECGRPCLIGSCQAGTCVWKL